MIPDISCVLPVAPPYTTVDTPPGGSVLVGNSIHYQCQEGYELTEGNMERYCLVNNDWDGSPPDCQRE